MPEQLYFALLDGKTSFLDQTRIPEHQITFICHECTNFVAQKQHKRPFTFLPLSHFSAVMTKLLCT